MKKVVGGYSIELGKFYLCDLNGRDYMGFFEYNESSWFTYTFVGRRVVRGLPQGRVSKHAYGTRQLASQLESLQTPSTSQVEAWLKAERNSQARKEKVEALKQPLEQTSGAIQRRFIEETPEWPLGKPFKGIFRAKEVLGTLKISFTILRPGAYIPWTLESIKHFEDLAREEGEKRGLELQGGTVFNKGTLSPSFTFTRK